MNEATSIHWTETAQAIGALIAIPGTFVTFFILIKKDKARQSEIKSLAAMSYNLSQMLELSERRLKREKKPRWKIEYSRPGYLTICNLKFTNVNHSTSIGSLFIEAVEGSDSVILDMDLINENEGCQEFTIKITPKDYSTFNSAVVQFHYDTFEGFQYTQAVTISKQPSPNPEYLLNYGTVVEVDE